MADTSVRISEETHARLENRKLVDSESFDSAIGRLLDETTDSEQAGAEA